MDRERTFNQQLDKALLAILTEAQQTRWKEMIGEPAGEELLAAARGFRADPGVVANMNAAMRGIPTAPSLFEVARVPGVARLLQLNEKQLAGARELAIEAERQRRGGFGFGGGRGGFGGGRGPGGRAALEALLQKRREEYEGRLKRLTELVGEEKFERLQQISRQASGLRDAFVMQQNREALGISSEQQQQASDILSDADPKYRATNSDDERQRVLSAFRTALDKLLTDEQRQKWQQMLGKPVEAKLLDEVLAARR